MFGTYETQSWTIMFVHGIPELKGPTKKVKKKKSVFFYRGKGKGKYQRYRFFVKIEPKDLFAVR